MPPCYDDLGEDDFKLEEEEEEGPESSIDPLSIDSSIKTEAENDIDNAAVESSSPNEDYANDDKESDVSGTKMEVDENIGCRKSERLSAKNLIYKWTEAAKRKEASGTVRKRTSKSFENKLEKASVSKDVLNKCKFKCPDCQVEYGTRDTFYKHLNKMQHAPMVYQSKSANDCLTKIVAHVCQVCQKKVLCDKREILAHVRVLHRMKTLQEYSDKTDASYESLEMKKKDIESFVAANLKSTKSIDLLDNVCSFSCQKCSYSCNSWASMTKHLNSKKHGPILSPTVYVTNAFFHKCGICNEHLLCDNHLLRKHLLWRHKLTLMQYQKKRNLPTYEETYPRYISELQAALKNIPVVSPLPGLVSPPESLLDSQVTKHVGNFSFFKCFLCDKSDMSHKNFACHLRDRHNKKHVTYDTETVLEARYHRCLICAKVILCDNSVLAMHLVKHKMKLPIYVAKHVEKNGGRAFPNYQEYFVNNKVFALLKQELETSDKTGANEIILPSVPLPKSEIGDSCGVNSKVQHLQNIDIDNTIVAGVSPNEDCVKKRSQSTNSVTQEVYVNYYYTNTLNAQDQDSMANVTKSHVDMPGSSIMRKRSSKLFEERKKVEKANVPKAPITQKTYLRYLAELQAALKDIPTVVPLQRLVSKPDSLPDFQVTNHIGNLSFFKCFLCSKSDMSEKNFSSHLRFRHNQKHVKYDTQNIVEARYHRCQICAKIILCDNSVIAMHLVKHKIKLPDYVKNHVETNGGRAFPTYPEYFSNNKVFEELKEEEAGDDDGLIMPILPSLDSETGESNGNDDTAEQHLQGHADDISHQSPILGKFDGVYFT